MVGEGEEEGKLIIEARVKRRCLSVRSAIFANMPPPPLSLSVTLRMRFFSMPSTAKTCSPAAGSSILAWIRSQGVRRRWGGAVGEMLATAPVDVPSARCVLCALGSFPVVSKSNCIPSTSSLSSLARSLALPPSAHSTVLAMSVQIFTVVRLRAALLAQ